MLLCYVVALIANTTVWVCVCVCVKENKWEEWELIDMLHGHDAVLWPLTCKNLHYGIRRCAALWLYADTVALTVLQWDKHTMNIQKFCTIKCLFHIYKLYASVFRTVFGVVSMVSCTKYGTYLCTITAENCSNCLFTELVFVSLRSGKQYVSQRKCRIS